jgi:hypothetical protein
MTYRHSERTKNSVHVSIWDSRDHELHEPRKLIKNAYQRDKKIKSARGVVFFIRLGILNTSQKTKRFNNNHTRKRGLYEKDYSRTATRLTSIMDL